jgi:2-hydroxycyclohexanecarboxyl-CoA dehydrogenase
VTGAGGAIGRAIALRLAEAGARVGSLDLSSTQAEATARSVEAAGGSAVPLEADITDRAAIERAVLELERRFEPIDVLVNCAGWDKLARFFDTGSELWDKLIAINFRGPLNVSHVVVRGMLERGRGRVVNIASDAGRVGSTGEAVYAGCKGAVIAFSKALAREVASKRITVNVVCPGPTDTPLLHSFLDEGEWGKKVHGALERAIPFGRLGKPDDVAGLVAFFASDEAAFITGQVVSVSGGLTMHG